MKDKIPEYNIKEERGTLIVKDYYRGIMSSGNGSVTYSERELTTMLKKYYPLKDKTTSVKQYEYSK